ncbi:MAG: putative phosphohydrolase [Anaerocolumna sp.]|jgi:predicted MPP superfamily phosphohydrolase|nr:putative phosphohydrolase [Anaerocolumna sp.]
MKLNQVIVAIILLFLLIEFIRNQFPKKVFYKIHSVNLPEAFNGYKIAVLADLHNKSFGKNNERLIKQMKELKPDIILIAGDLLVRKQPRKFDVALILLKELSKICPIYYGLGNHEQSIMSDDKKSPVGYADFVNKVRKMGIIFLDNESIIIKRKSKQICITGLSIEKMFFQKFKLPPMPEVYLQNLVGFLNKECYNILIAHNPTYFERYISLGADLTVSGHLHGGVIRLPFLGGMLSPQYRFFPDYDGGRYEKDSKTMLVSRGLGGHTIKFRIFNRPEIVVVTLTSR